MKEIVLDIPWCGDIEKLKPYMKEATTCGECGGKSDWVYSIGPGDLNKTGNIMLIPICNSCKSSYESMILGIGRNILGAASE